MVTGEARASFESGHRNVLVRTVPPLSMALGVPIEELLESEAKLAKRGPTPKLQRQLELLQELPCSEQRFVSEMLDTMLQQAGR